MPMTSDLKCRTRRWRRSASSISIGMRATQIPALTFLLASALCLSGAPALAKHATTTASTRSAETGADNSDPCASMTSIANAHLATARSLKAILASREKSPPPTALAALDRLLGWSVPDTETPRKLSAELKLVEQNNEVLVSKDCKPVVIDFR